MKKLWWIVVAILFLFGGCVFPSGGLNFPLGGFNLLDSTFNKGIKGACVYGPSGLKSCINGVYKDECEINFRGVWYPGKRCP